MTIFKTDPRLRNLIRTNSVVYMAQHLATRDGDDTEALIVAVQVLAQQVAELNKVLGEYAKLVPPPAIIVPADSVNLDGLRMVDEAKG
jgi:hypothetical protein